MHLPIIKNGAAKLIPMNSIPKYMAKPKAAIVAITADMLPIKPSQGFERTTSPIIHVIMLWAEGGSSISEWPWDQGKFELT